MCTVCARPALRSPDEVLFRSIGEEVAQALKEVVVAEDEDGSVPTTPELVTPVAVFFTPQLPSDVAVDVAHDRGELLWISNPDEQGVVIRQEGISVESKAVALLCTPQNSEHERPVSGCWFEEKSPLDGTCRDLSDGDGLCCGIGPEFSFVGDKA